MTSLIIYFFFHVVLGVFNVDMRHEPSRLDYLVIAGEVTYRGIRVILHRYMNRKIVERARGVRKKIL